LHEPSGDFHQVGLPSRASLRIPSRNRLTDRDSSHGLCFPTAHAESKVPFAKGLPADRGSARRVWLPSRRINPFDASPVLFRTGSTHGVHPSKLSPRERHPDGFPPEEPTYRFAAAHNLPKVIACELTAAVSGSCPFESPWRSNPCLAGQSLDAPLGFALPGQSSSSLAGISPGLLSRASCTGEPAHRHPRVSIGCCLVWPTRGGKPSRSAKQPS
jgi:hypothetical protein